MKLYTEEQLIYAIKMARSSTNIFTTPFLYDKDEILDILIPIELPSDEEIEQECRIGKMDTNQQLCFQLGAKWMRDKIQGGDQ